MQQEYFSSTYNDEKAIENYYEYTTFEEEKSKTQIKTVTPTSQEALLVQQAFGQNSEYLKRNYSTERSYGIIMKGLL